MRKLTFAVALVSCARFECFAATWYVDASAVGWQDGRTWETAFRTIGRALQRNLDGDTVVVAEGTYQENLSLWQCFVLRSKDPSDPRVVAATIIDGGAAGPVVTFDGSECETTVLEGFTITNGKASDGGGIYGNGTLATIRNNIISRNVAEGSEDLRLGASGGAIYRCNGLIENNVISENVAGKEGWPDGRAGSGGAIAYCAGTIRDNVIVGNSAVGETCNPEFPWNCDTAFGAGLFVCNGTIEGNLIGDNWCESGGGGICWSWARIVGNTLTGNSGGALMGFGGEAANNVIAMNIGSGIYGFEGLIANNAIIGNSRRGLGECYGTIEDCIIWGNTGPQVEDSDLPSYSCIQDWTAGGEGNISEDPRFVDAGNGDFRLRADSPCIDAGFNSPELPEFDIAGVHRIMFGGKSLTVDMGAYEFYINKLDPVPGTDQAVFTWSSLSDKTYSIFYTDDLFNWHTAIDNFPSLGNTTTSWLDDGSLTGIPPLLASKRFYRLMENP